VGPAPALPHQGLLTLARRVGFGDETEDADASASEPRRDGGDAAPSPKAAVADGEAKPLKRLIGGAFLMVWLAAWAMGVLFALTLIPEMWREGEAVGAGFLTLFVAIASAFWLIGLRTLMKIARGEPVRMRSRVRPSALRNLDDPGRD
ncbi:MAG: hypothetical protein AAFU55_17200, partial [Pseudomonadota bacterium]